MIRINEMPGYTFQNKAQMFEAIRENKGALFAQKGMATKFSDPMDYAPALIEAVSKADGAGMSPSMLKMELAINTTNVMDSHSDVHIPGLWKKSLQEQKAFYLLQEHKMQFDHIITDSVKASVRNMTWKELGAKWEGNSQVLVFDVENGKERNGFMFSQYSKGYVKNHSVGMRYVKMMLAMNSDSKWDVEEKENWDKYISQVANKEAAEDQGYFWPILEAKIIEGSAVPLGSNSITPVISIEEKEAAKGTSNTIGAAEGTPNHAAMFCKKLL